MPASVAKAKSTEGFRNESGRIVKLYQVKIWKHSIERKIEELFGIR
jgi:hypothetical protein